MSTKRELRCRDLGFDCTGVVIADNDEEVLRQATVHAREVHGVEITPEIAAQAQALIHDAKAATA